MNSQSRWKSSCVAALLVVCVGCNSSVNTATPEAAFNSMTAAAKNKDWKSFCACLTPQSLDTMAGSMVMVASMSKMFGSIPGGGGDNPEMKSLQEMSQKAEKILARYGVSEDALAKASPTYAPDEQGIAVLAAGIRDKSGFVGEMMQVMNSMATKNSPGHMNWESATLSNLTIDGDSASGTIKIDGDENPIRFQRVGGAWLVELMDQ